MDTELAEDVLDVRLDGLRADHEPTGDSVLIEPLGQHSQHCVTATVKDQYGNATPAITVRFSVTGSVTTSGSASTNASGQATFCYQGPALAGADAITAYADTNTNSVQDLGETG